MHVTTLDHLLNEPLGLFGETMPGGRDQLYFASLAASPSDCPGRVKRHARVIQVEHLERVEVVDEKLLLVGIGRKQGQLVHDVLLHAYELGVQIVLDLGEQLGLACGHFRFAHVYVGELVAVEYLLVVVLFHVFLHVLRKVDEPFVGVQDEQRIADHVGAVFGRQVLVVDLVGRFEDLYLRFELKKLVSNKKKSTTNIHTTVYDWDYYFIIILGSNLAGILLLQILIELFMI